MRLNISNNIQEAGFEKLLSGNFNLNIIFCTGFSNSVVDISVSYQPNVDRLEEIFKAYLPLNKMT